MRQGVLGFLLLVLMCVSSLSGCAGSAGPEGVSVSGSVVQGGKAQEGVSVNFITADPSKADSRGARTNAEGKFELKVKPGAYTVTMTRLVDKKGNVPAESENPAEDFTQLEASGYLRNAFPPKYAAINTSPYKVEIPSGGKTLEPFDVSTK